jgi:hypothetical protein
MKTLRYLAEIEQEKNSEDNGIHIVALDVPEVR